MTLIFEVGVIFLLVGVSGEFEDVTCSYWTSTLPSTSEVLKLRGIKLPGGFIKTQC